MSKICFSGQGSPSLSFLSTQPVLPYSKKIKIKNCHQERLLILTRNFYWSNLKEDLQEGKYICTFEIINSGQNGQIPLILKYYAI